MQYLTILKGQQPNIKTTAGGVEKAVFPNTKLGVDGLREYALAFTNFGSQLEAGNAGLYITQAGSPIELPFPMNLNYVDLENAKKLDPNQLEKAIQVMSQYDEGDIINSGAVVVIPSDVKNPVGQFTDDSFEDEGYGDEYHTPDFAYQMNHSREQLIHILSSVCKTLGTVIICSRCHEDDPMGHQVLITKPLLWNKIDQDKAIQLINGEQTSFRSLTQIDNEDNEDNENDRGDYGFGGDWWKNPQEAIKRISKIITEDPDIFD